MNINLEIEEGFFHINPCTFCGIESYLIIPQIDAKWNKSNLYLRSIIVDTKGTVLSCGFPKFFNYGEKPECYPDPNTFNDWKIEEKIDGSLLIADYVNGEFSMRTRGTCSYKAQENSKDFELLIQKYPKVVDFLKQNSHLSLLFEIVTPNNVIVVRPKEIDFYLLGAFNKNGMVVVSSSNLTDIWREIGPIPVPQSYHFNDTSDLSKISQYIKNWKGKEGIVVSYNNGQNRIKLKSDWYCWIHKIKSKLNSENNLIEHYVKSKMPSHEDFFRKIETEYDYEIAVQLKEEIERICQIGKEVKENIERMKNFVSSIRGFKTRKEQAEHIITNYKKCNFSSFVFNLLDGKELDDNQVIKMFHQFIENNH